MESIPFTARHDEFWDAVRRRDSAYRGVFCLGVRTTGVFCRPGCPARFPHRRNVEFLADARAALHAGYRPCLRCHPLQSAPAGPLVERLKAMVDADPSLRITGAGLAAEGIDASTARRQFQRAFGMSFAAYQRARRMGAALVSVRAGGRLIDTQLDHGFASSSGFRDAFHRLFGAPPSRGAGARCLAAQWIASPLGPLLALAGDDGLHLLDWVDRRGLEREILRLRNRERCAIVPGEHAVIDQLREELAAYFAGRSARFQVALAPRGTPFQREVWNALLAIPAGQTRSYADMARRIGRETAVRAMARANGDNFRGIVIPCHRVIGSDGALTGYGGGLARKQWLIDHERTHFARLTVRANAQDGSRVK